MTEPPVPADTLRDVQDRLVAFRDQRDWQQFHTLKDLALAITVEAGELQELLLWVDDDTVLRDRRADVEQEIADVMIQALNFCNAAGIDAAGVIAQKVRLNAERYPVERAKGNATKYTEL